MGAKMKRVDSYYYLGLGLAVASLLFLVLAIGALGIVGEGGRPDRLYAAVVAVALVGTVLARLRARGMALTMLATAAAQAVVGLGALVLVLAGVEDFEGASVVDLIGINAMYVGLFVASAWLFRRSVASSPVDAGALQSSG
jgi:hypothetical protein